MADEKDLPEGEEKPKREPVSPVVRKRLQQCFAQGSKVSNAGQFDYATSMFSTCVAADPANIMYLQNFLGNLQKKYNNNKKGAGTMAAMGLMGTRATLQKNVLQKDWMTVIKTGLEILKVNPWDVNTLLNMATACAPDALACPECELLYLRTALEVNMKDAAVNKRAGQALENQGQFDQAIICWRRVEEASPKDLEEARKKIGDLSVKRTIDKGGYEKASTSGTSQDVKADKSARPALVAGGGMASGMSPEAEVGRRLTPEEMLKRSIQKDPGDVSNYLQLADLYKNAERWKEAEAVYAKAHQASGGGDAAVLEKLEDVQILLREQAIGVAEAKYKAEQTEDNKELYKSLKRELNKFEMDVYRRRTERNPTVKGLWADYAMRLQKEGFAQGKEGSTFFKEAIRAYQKARGDESRKGLILLGLGYCFQAEKQYQLAMSHYKDAEVAIPESEADLKKEVLYAVGKLAMGLNDKDVARDYLTRLASMDYAYKDVAERLDKLTQG